MRRRFCLPLLVVLLLALGWIPGPAASAAPPVNLSRPVDGAVTRAFDPPDQRWGAGHRGVDLAAGPGTVVRAAADGVVTFSGTIAGRGVVAVTHVPASRLRTTYEPLVPSVRAGQRVKRGQELGRIADTVDRHDGLHWGLIEGETYLDPLAWSQDRVRASADEVRLLPAGATPSPVEIDTVPYEPVGVGLPLAGGGSSLPADGPITSRFGMRLHPVLGVWKLHDGLDLGAPCGAPVRAVAAGRVVTVEHHVAYGNRVIVDHGGRRTGYAHLSAASVTVGQRVAAGQQLGRVGTTGWSTGCHLHVMAWSGGRVIDPAPLLGL
ncbi:peptidoglycan DD-metalloendopeptidase family protein [Aestuariimicrobium soli]|uniref:peptidoglycan DD-metalloendopeptidase family protein n=1 Tax=Aestuariimicrobium soli TaxID=2035834 RepID=UPI003EB8D69C